MRTQSYASTEDALADIVGTDDVAFAAYLFAGARPTVIRVRREASAYACTFDDGGAAVSQYPFRTIEELHTILAPKPGENPTYVAAVAAIVTQFLRREVDK